jgi:predicted amidophosphoribosyltransferase
MSRMICPDCRIEVPSVAWACPNCGKPGEQEPGKNTGREISTKGMVLLLLLFVVFPVVLFLIHIFVPGM